MKFIKRSASFILLVFTINTILPVPVYAQTLNLPPVGQMVMTTQAYAPAIVKGIKIFPDNPLRFDFIVDTGDTGLEGEQLKKESEKLIKYFLASLTTPEEDIWVNLSPYEKDRIIPNLFGQTEMGRDLLAQDYILKQLTASLMYPEDELGEEFWDKIFEKAYEKYGTTEIPINTFNKVWIMPEKAVVYENEDAAFVVESKLKVMLEEDYLALDKNSNSEKFGINVVDNNDVKELSNILSSVVRDIILPAIEREVNEGEHFAQLRQIYHALILATWFKMNLKESLLGQIYVDQNKIAGVDVEDKKVKDKIYNQYLEAFKEGVYDYIKEDFEPGKQEIIPRKYFSGGFGVSPEFKLENLSRVNDQTISTSSIEKIESGSSPMITINIMLKRYDIDESRDLLKVNSLVSIPDNFSLELKRILTQSLKGLDGEEITNWYGNSVIFAKNFLDVIPVEVVKILSNRILLAKETNEVSKDVLENYFFYNEKEDLYIPRYPFKANGVIFQDITDEKLSLEKKLTNIILQNRRSIGLSIVGIAGEASVGKTTLIKKQKEILERQGVRVRVLKIDSYLKARSERRDKKLQGFDKLHIEKLKRDIRNLREGRSFFPPEYIAQTGEISRGNILDPKVLDVVLLEGNLSFALEQIRDQIDLNVYLDEPFLNRFNLRIERDQQERGYTRGNAIVNSLEVQHIESPLVRMQAKYADIIVKSLSQKIFMKNVHVLDVNENMKAFINNLVENIFSKTASNHLARNYRPGDGVIINEKGKIEAEVALVMEHPAVMHANQESQARIKKAFEYLLIHPRVSELVNNEFVNLLYSIVNILTDNGEEFYGYKHQLDENMYPIYINLRNIINSIENPKKALRTAMMYAAIGNFLDLTHTEGIRKIGKLLGLHLDLYSGAISSDELQQVITLTFNKINQGNIIIDGFESFFQRIEGREGETIVYFLDNHGEVILDQLVIEQLLQAGYYVSVVGRSHRVRDDVSWEEAKDIFSKNQILQQYLYDGRLNILTDGSETLGADLTQSYKHYNFIKTWEKSAAFIAKGAGNLRSLYGQKLSLPGIFIRMMKESKYGYKILGNIRQISIENRTPFDTAFVYQAEDEFYKDKKAENDFRQKFLKGVFNGSHTFGMIKPDAYDLGIVDEIIDLINSSGFQVDREYEIELTEESIHNMYKGKENLDEIVQYLMSGESLALFISSKNFEEKNTINKFREIQAKIRTLYKAEFLKNRIHASDSVDEVIQHSNLIFEYIDTRRQRQNLVLEYRQKFILEAVKLLNFLAVAHPEKEASSMTEDDIEKYNLLLLALGSPSVQTFINLADQWKKYKNDWQIEIPIIASTGKGRGLYQLLKNTKNYLILQREDLLKEFESMVEEAGESLTEAKIIKYILVAHGVSNKVIFLEEDSDDTQSNMQYSYKIINDQVIPQFFNMSKDKNIKIHIVTDGFHRLRALLTAMQEFWSVQGEEWLLNAEALYVPNLSMMSDDLLLEYGMHMIGNPNGKHDGIIFGEIERIKNYGLVVFSKKIDSMIAVNWGSEKMEYFRNYLLRRFQEGKEQLIFNSPLKMKKIKGGIDFNPNNLNIETQGQGIDYNAPIDPQLLESLTSSPIEGFTPVIFNITPILNLPQVLGLNDQDNKPLQQSKVPVEEVYIPKYWQKELEIIA